jgi:hypothetical protein
MHVVHAPTLTQYALAACFLVLGPAFGALAAVFARTRGVPVATAVLVASGASWGAWLVACVVAVVLFPGYPLRNAPPEWVAMLFTLPGIVAGALAILHARGDSVLDARTRRAALLIAGVALLASAMLVEGHRQLTMWPARRHLPAGSVVLREEIVEDGFLPDYTYTMDAAMTHEQFDAWMRDLGLVPCSPLGRWCRPGQPEDGEWGARGSFDGSVGHFGSWDS